MRTPSIVLATALLTACASTPPAPDTASGASALTVARAAPTLVYFVRHAEKALDQGDDPQLTPAGTERAQALDALLRQARVTHLYSTPYKRTQATLAPLATRLGLTVVTIGAKDDRAQLDALRALPPGSVAVVAGHSNTVPGMVRDLGGAAPELDDAHYDRLFLVALARTGTTTRATTTELRYGATSPD